MVASGCQAGPALTTDVAAATDEDGDNVGRPPSTPWPTKVPPTPSACPRLGESLQRAIAVVPPTPYRPSVEVEYGRTPVSIETTADDQYLRDRYGVDVFFRIDAGRRASGRAPLSQLCALANDPNVLSVSAPERVRIPPTGVGP
jgi:hypothetical protein